MSPDHVSRGARPRLVDVARVWVGPSLASPPPAEASSQDFGIRHEDTAAFRARVAAECLDCLGMLRSYREPVAGETWLIPAASERRLLAQAQAVLVLGPAAMAQAQSLALDPDVPDPDRVFAALFVVGSTAGREYLEQGLPIFQAAVERDRAEAAAAVEALCICPSVELPHVMLPTLQHASPAVRAAAVRVLGYRGELTSDQWCRAIGDSDQRVVMSALGAALHETDRGRANQTLQPLYTSDQEMLVRAALRAGLSLGLPAALEAARQIATTAPAWADSLYLVALHGHSSDQPLIERSLALHFPAAARALGRAGWLALGPRLITSFAATPSAAVLAPEVMRALSCIVALPDPPPTDPNSLAHGWAQVSRELNPALRHRDGKPLTLIDLAAQLRTGSLNRPQRQELYFELQLLTQGQLPRFNAFDFVGQQFDALDRLDAWLAQQGASAPHLH